MKNKIQAAFANCSLYNCLSFDTSENIIVYDDDVASKSCVFVGAIQGLPRPFFTIHNPKKKEIGILAIDNCIMRDEDGDGQRCDFGCFDEKMFFFVELKRALGGAFNKRTKKEQAIDQLKATLTNFTNKLDFGKYRICACACVGYSAPSPAAPAADLNTMVEFINKFNAELHEGDSVTFD